MILFEERAGKGDVGSMRVRVRTEVQLLDVDRFDPLELVDDGGIVLYHRACGGRSVVLEVEGDEIHFTCPRCRDEESAGKAESIKAFRRLLSGGRARQTVNSHLTLVRVSPRS